MTTGSTTTTPAFAPAALAASQVGTWETDVAVDRFRCDPIAARLLGLSPAEAEEGVSVQRPRSVIVPEDRDRVIAELGHAGRSGGLMIVEYRIQSPSVGTRWVLVRGCFEVDRGRGIVGRGIVIDVTDSKQDGYAAGRVHFASSDLMEGSSGALDHLAELALAARRTVDRIGGRTASLLSPLADALLFGIGQRIAASLGRLNDGEDEPDTPPERPH